MAESGFDSVSTIKGKLTKVLSSLEQYERKTKLASSKQTEEKMTEINQRTSEALEDKLGGLRSEFTQQLQQIMLKFNSSIESSTESLKVQYKTSQNTPSPTKLFIEKVHKKQSAPISKLLYSKDFQTIYNIFLAILLNIGIAELARDLLDNNDTSIATLFTGNFSKFDAVIKIWVCFVVWSYFTTILVQLRHLPFSLLVLLHLSSILLQAFVAVTYVQVSELPIASSFVVLCEAIRCCLKMHSYFREKFLHGNGENSYKHFIPSYAQGVNQSDIALPRINIESWSVELQRYTYYLFAPTLIYRDHYPKIDRSIRWRNLSVHLFDFFGAIIYTSLIFKAYCVPEFQSASKNITNSHAVLLSWFRSMLPGTIVFLLLFFAVMHSWFSIWGEILNFADRKFYDDWWNSKDFGTFIRKISVILYEWLHSYVFIDLQRFSKNFFGPRTARLTVFVLSGVIIELIIDYSLGFFFPYVFFIVAAPGAFMISFNNRASRIYNVLVWVLLIMVMGLIIMLYSLEYYYRLDQVDKRDFQKYGSLAYFIPQWVYQLTINT